MFLFIYHNENNNRYKLQNIKRIVFLIYTYSKFVRNYAQENYWEIYFIKFVTKKRCIEYFKSTRYENLKSKNNMLCYNVKYSKMTKKIHHCKIITYFEKPKINLKKLKYFYF